MATKDINLGSLILPIEVFSHFEFVDVIDAANEIQLFLDEKFVPPSPSGYSSKGFTGSMPKSGSSCDLIFDVAQ